MFIIIPLWASVRTSWKATIFTKTQITKMPMVMTTKFITLKIKIDKENNKSPDNDGVPTYMCHPVYRKLDPPWNFEAPNGSPFSVHTRA